MLSYSVLTATQNSDLSCGVDHDTLQAKWGQEQEGYFFEACQLTNNSSETSEFCFSFNFFNANFVSSPLCLVLLNSQYMTYF